MTDKYYAICFDIDDCLAKFVPSSDAIFTQHKKQHSHRLPQAYTQHILLNMRKQFFGVDTDSPISHTHIQLRLFTNRKDQRTDNSVSKREHTASAKSILQEMAVIMQSWLDSSTSSLELDDRLHHEQVFSDNVKCYDQCLQEISAENDAHSPYKLYASSCQSNHTIRHRSLAGKDKFDLLMSVLWSLPRKQPWTVIIVDDRLAKIHPDNLDKLTQCLKQNPQCIPCHITLACYQLDPYTDEQRMQRFADTHYNKAKFTEKHPDKSPKDEDFISALNLFREAETNHYSWRFDDSFMAQYLAKRYHTDDLTATLARFQRAFRQVECIKGHSTASIDFNKAQCWQNCLLPLGKLYHEFCSSKTPEAIYDRNPLACVSNSHCKRKFSVFNDSDWPSNKRSQAVNNKEQANLSVAIMTENTQAMTTK